MLLLKQPKMQKIRIFSFPSHSPGSHVSGVDYPRIIQPMKFLHGYKDDEVEISVMPWNGEKISVARWDLICNSVDILYLNYTLNDWSFASMGTMARKHKIKIVMDLDDLLWKIGKDNTVYDSYKKDSKGIGTVTCIINEVDHITCTNGYLRNGIANYTRKTHEKISVFPNYVDLNLYNQKPEFKNTPNINIVHYGSSSHYSDLNNPEFIKGIEKIMYEYPNVTFITIGSFFGQFKEKWGKRYEEEFGALNFLEWAKVRFPQVMTKTDIFVAPLNFHEYNMAKSSIKFLEVSTSKKAGCWADIRQYQEVIKNGVNGFLCRTADDWYQNIKKLCDDAILRKKMGEEAYKTVKRDWQMVNHVKEYAEMFKRVLTS